MIKKLSRQREENSQLVNQNHKLMTELENLSYDLHQARKKVSKKKIGLVDSGSKNSYCVYIIAYCMLINLERVFRIKWQKTKQATAVKQQFSFQLTFRSI